MLVYWIPPLSSLCLSVLRCPEDDSNFLFYLVRAFTFGFLKSLRGNMIQVPGLIESQRAIFHILTCFPFRQIRHPWPVDVWTITWFLSLGCNKIGQICHLRWYLERDWISALYLNEYVHKQVTFCIPKGNISSRSFHSALKRARSLKGARN